jgi:3-methyladenine DNA glycosylase/8-oxoguanine DNA glycosylase
MSAAYPLWDRVDPTVLPGIGEYGAHSYLIFIRGQLDVLPKDKELRKFLEWMKSRS